MSTPFETDQRPIHITWVRNHSYYSGQRTFLYILAALMIAGGLALLIFSYRELQSGERASAALLAGYGLLSMVSVWMFYPWWRLVFDVADSIVLSSYYQRELLEIERGRQKRELETQVVER
jgi:hypothetical protein